MVKVAVFMSTYNGEKYLREQIESILAQKHVKVFLYVRDDGSSDTTVDILKEFKENKKLEFYVGENINYGKSFWELMLKYGEAEKFDYFAFSDQDDFWEPVKLSKALDLLGSNAHPKLYFSNMEFVSSDLKSIGLKKFDNMRISLGSEMIRHRVAGCTYVFNKSLFEFAKYVDFTSFKKKFEHDVWLYILCLSVEGEVIRDKSSYIKYRQHSDNVTGHRQGLIKRMRREVLSHYLYQEKKNLKQSYFLCLYKHYEDYISNENKKIIEQVINYKTNLGSKINLLKNKDFRSGNFVFDTISILEVFFGVY